VNLVALCVTLDGLAKLSRKNLGVFGEGKPFTSVANSFAKRRVLS
jgi:hypothetical protein